ncbi:HDOD domain-containing protein [Sedimenticola selenatireducens]|uniref:HDOD domain-containing protein n=1 Tax=Sedimenticola selenatireducens TaxID=191960 RepID=A0A557SJV4_9GAMM|nr:HDOD domain-containing protein [Sedimenticola selenatireducens]TVO77640.1 HDOD domain-containing protein [Sedimenticola selenatireducens]TVT64946.1 MAG: HDOD domain-containing protein [Sedimenticola selenatireducens]
MIGKAEFFESLQTAINNNQITLPTLPEVALRVRDAVEQENVTAHQIADMVATDAALSARLLQVANSPLYRGRVTIDTIQMAITRLGFKLVRSLVVSLAMKQIFQATSDTLDVRLRTMWEQSVEVAAISRVLAQSITHLDKDQAMLAGLIHNIGALPILTWAESYPELMEDEAALDELVEELTPAIGVQILNTWGFNETLVKAAEQSRNLQYDGGPKADYVDIVIVARLQTQHSNQIASPADWLQVPAFLKVGLDPEIELIEIEGVAEDIESVQGAFL